MAIWTKKDRSRELLVTLRHRDRTARPITLSSESDALAGSKPSVFIGLIHKTITVTVSPSEW